jgi:hypothetical protein
MASTLAKVTRVENLEERVPLKPCKKHPGLLVFIEGDGDIDKKLAEIRRCRSCKGRQKVTITFERFATVPPNVPPVLTIGDGDKSNDDDW